jgi:hypothetical protein
VGENECVGGRMCGKESECVGENERERLWGGRVRGECCERERELGRVEVCEKESVQEGESVL